MAKQCEACSVLARQAEKPPGSNRIRNLLVGGRLVRLCELHAKAVRVHNPNSVDEIRETLKETDGSRSLVTRRSAVNRRVFPPRLEGRRLRAGRRWTDRER